MFFNPVSYTQYAEVDGKYILLGINKRNKARTQSVL